MVLVDAGLFVLDEEHLGLDAAGHAVANEPGAFGPVGLQDGQLVVVVVQAGHAGQVAEFLHARVRHQMVRAVAEPQLRVLAALDAAGAVAIMPVHVQIVVLPVPAVPLRYAHLPHFRLVFDLLNRYVPVVMDVRRNLQDVRLQRGEGRHLVAAEDVDLSKNAR